MSLDSKDPNSLAYIQHAIGIEPRPQNEAIMLEILQTSPVRRNLAIAWLVKNGLPFKNAQYAFNTSIAKAYCNPSYLCAWRNRLLNNKAEDDASDLNEPKDSAQNIAQNVAHINKSEVDQNPGLQHEQFSFLSHLVQARNKQNSRPNIWLAGPAGSGKTTAIENVAKVLGLPFGSDGPLNTSHKVSGFRDAQGNIISKQFLEIYEKGGIYVADKIDTWRPSAILSLNAALADGWANTPNDMVMRHPDCCIIACVDTVDLGPNTNPVRRTPLDRDFLDHFHPKVNWRVDENLERAVAKKMHSTLGEAWHDIILASRRAAKQRGVKVTIGPRATFNGIALLNLGFSLKDVIETNITAGLTPEQASALMVYQLVRKGGRLFTVFKTFNTNPSQDT